MSTENKSTDKPMTKYDRKMAARKEAAIKEAKSYKRFKIGCAAAALIIIAAVVASIALVQYKKYDEINGTYITVGDRAYSKQKFDFYYYLSINEFYSSYGSLASLMGLDITGDLSKQQYSDEQTWQDFFEERAVNRMLEYIALTDAGEAAGFEYDTDEDWNSLLTTLQMEADSAGVTLENYIKGSFGGNANEEIIEPLAREAYYSAAYRAYLEENTEHTDEEIMAYYEQDTSAYDLVDYRSFVLAADIPDDATDEQIEAAMAETKKTVEAFVKAYQAGGDFDALCLEYAPEDQISAYAEGALAEGSRYSNVSDIFKEWIFDDSRTAGDIEIFENESSHYYAVAEFVDRYFDDSVKEEIASTMTSEEIIAYVDELMAQYEVKK